MKKFRKKFLLGLDASLEPPHICVVDEGGPTIKETRAASEPEAIAKAIRPKDVALITLGARPTILYNGDMKGS
jgi:hypothetical protein